MKKVQNKKLLVIGGIFVGLICVYLVANFFLSRVITSSLNKAGEYEVTKEINKLSFENARVLDINQDLSSYQGILLSIQQNKGKLYISHNPSQEDSIQGKIKYLGAEPKISLDRHAQGSAVYNITSGDEQGEEIALQLSQKTNGVANITLGVVSADIDLREVDLPEINVSAGAADLTFTFSEKYNIKANISAGAGKMKLLVPKNSERRVSIAGGVGEIENPDLIKTENGYKTKGYDTAKVKIDINISQAVGGYSIETY